MSEAARRSDALSAKRRANLADWAGRQGAKQPRLDALFRPPAPVAVAAPAPAEEGSSTAERRTAAVDVAFREAEDALSRLAQRLDAPAPAVGQPVAEDGLASVLATAEAAGASKVTVTVEFPSASTEAAAPGATVAPKKKRTRWKRHYEKACALVLERGAEMAESRSDYERDCTGCYYKPLLRCKVTDCNVVFRGANLNNMDRGQGVGCPGCNPQPWKNRYEEACSLVSKRGAEMVESRTDFERDCTGVEYKPLLRCTDKDCNLKFRAACLDSMQQGGGAGCPSCTTSKNLWVQRYDDACELTSSAGGEMVESREDYTRGCEENKGRYKPLVRCKKCKLKFRGACLNSMQQRLGIGCPGCKPAEWTTRYDEAVALIAAKNGKLLVAREEWPEVCTGSLYTPPIECLGCGDTVASTALSCLRNGKGFGCVGCKNKTEGKLRRWLESWYPDVQTQQPKFKRCGYTKGPLLAFDFSLSTERWIIELDGNIPYGHFSDEPDNDCPVRDLEKEEWALEHDYQVIRVLQDDVWRGKNGWENYLSTELANWATRRDAGQAPRKAITPQAPEYLGGVYKRLRSTVDTGPQLDDGGCTFCGAVVGGGDVCMNCGTLQGAAIE